MDAQRFAARVQAALAMILIIAVALVVFMLLGLEFMMLLRHLPPNQALEALLNTGYNALINLAAIGIGFWLARHRPKQDDGTDDTIAPATPAPPVNPTLSHQEPKP